MGKKSSGKTYVSKGERKNVSNATRAAMRAARPKADKIVNALDAWLKGKTSYITIENPDKNATNKRFIRVKMTDMKKGTAKDLEKKNYMV